MAEEKASQEKLTDLRRRAEEAIRSQAASEEELSPEQARHLIHELQVYQIELELQNEELRQAQLQLGESANK